MLKEVQFPIHRRFKSRTEWEPIGFFSDCLCNATQFDLMLGFFSSSAINVLADGFVKSIAKEFKKGIAANVIYVDEGAEQNLESTLRFSISARSAYVSGQIIQVSKAAVVDVDWAKPLAGKTAVVTGASRGIGEAIAHVLARDGAHVICLDVPQQQADLDRVANEIGGSTLAIDITAEDAGEKIKQAAAVYGGLDIIVQNAGITRDKTLANMKPELWDLVININLSAIERVNDYLLSHDGLNENGHIVCVSSISGIAGNLGQTKDSLTPSRRRYDAELYITK